MNMFVKIIIPVVIVVGIASSAANGAAVLTRVGDPNPDGVPTTGTRFKVGIFLDDAINDSGLAVSLFVSNAIQSTAPGAVILEANFSDFPNVHFANEVASADLADPAYSPLDDSYMTAPWARLPVGGAPSAPMNIPAAIHGALGDLVPGGQTVDLALITVPEGGVVTITGVIQRTEDLAFALNHTLDSNGTLTAIPEPSAFLFLGMLAVGLIARKRIKTSRRGR